MWLHRVLRRQYTGLIYICCTFIVTYVFMKGSCMLSGDLMLDEPVSNQDTKLALVMARNVKDPGQPVHVNQNVDAERKPQPRKMQKTVDNAGALDNRVQVDNVGAGKSDVNKTEHKPVIKSVKADKHSKNSPVAQIAFLKVHKAGSSTVQNILFRFGLRYNLTFALPAKGHYVYSTKSLIPVKEGGHYDMFACHTIYTADRFSSVLPKGFETLAIIREPLKRMISAAFYYRDALKKSYLMKVPKETLIQELINNPEVNDPEIFSRTRNSMGFDFGFSRHVTPDDRNMINMYMSYLKTNFKLVLMMDRFDESLVLMRRRYNWSLRDIIYLKSNSHAHPPVNLTTNEINKFKKLSFLDYEIYNKFSVMFDAEVKKLGADFQSEVKNFRKVLGDVSAFCTNRSKTIHSEVDLHLDVSTHTGTGTILTVPKSEWNTQFGVTLNECALMELKDLQFVDKMKARHRKMNGIL